jgi:hypothetical protein
VRRTLHIDEDVYQAAKRLADAEKVSIGKALSDLARRGLIRPPAIEKKRGVPVFSVPTNAPPLSLELVRRALDDDF